MIKIRNGLDIHIMGAPVQSIDGIKMPKTVALIGEDSIGLRPHFLVREGDHVQKGQVLFTDTHNPGVNYTASSAGIVESIHHNHHNRFESLIIRVEGKGEVVFPDYTEDQVAELTGDEVKGLLLDSGMWTALRSRPFSKIPKPTSIPNSIFVTAIDTQPLAPHPSAAIIENQNIFRTGLIALSKLTRGPVHLCTGPNTNTPIHGLPFVKKEVFDGPHPSGNPGTHIHFLDPVGPEKEVWHINYQDVIAIGHLLLSGRLYSHRIISIAGPSAASPRLVRTVLGASIQDIMDGELSTRSPEDHVRIISGSVLSGRIAAGPLSYLGRYHMQVTALTERPTRHFLKWMGPGSDQFSIKNVFFSTLCRSQLFDFDTHLNGERRAMIPVGAYESVMPLDIHASLLLRSILSGDTETAVRLGCLELDEDDLALCTFVCPSKIDFGVSLRHMLTSFEQGRLP